MCFDVISLFIDQQIIAVCRKPPLDDGDGVRET